MQKYIVDLSSPFARHKVITKKAAVFKSVERIYVNLWHITDTQEAPQESVDSLGAT